MKDSGADEAVVLCASRLTRNEEEIMSTEKGIRTMMHKSLLPLLIITLLFPMRTLSQEKKGIEELIRDLNDESPVVRWSAAEGLGKAKDVRAVKPLIEALRDKDEGVRRGAIMALGEIGDPQAVEPLGEMFKDQDELSRANALVALEKIGGEQAVELIISALKNDNSLVRMNASAILGKRGNSKAIGPLEEVARNDPVSYVRFSAEQALVWIRGEGGVSRTEKTTVKGDELPPPALTPPAEEHMPLDRGPVTEGKNAELIAEMKAVAERLHKEYNVVLDYMKYDVMDLLDIEARMKMRHPKDTIESLLGDLLTKEDKERNRHLFRPKE